MSSIISLDPSSPAFAASFPNFSTSSTSETSPSFSPLPGSLLVVLASWTGSYSSARAYPTHLAAAPTLTRYISALLSSEPLPVSISGLGTFLPHHHRA